MQHLFDLGLAPAVRSRSELLSELSVIHGRSSCLCRILVALRAPHDLYLISRLRVSNRLSSTP